MLARISQEVNGINRAIMLQNIVDEMADGGRNIIHMCVAMCAPTSNKDASTGMQ